MAEQYNFMSGASGSLPMGAFQRARQTDAASRDPYYQLNTAIKQHELEAARWTMHAKAFDMQMQINQKKGIAELSGIMAAGPRPGKSMLHDILKTANRWGMDNDQIKHFTDLAKQMEDREATMSAMRGDLPPGARREVTHGPSGTTVKITPEAESEKAEALARVRKLRGDALNFRSKGMEDEALILERKADEEAEWFGRQQSGTLVMKDDQSLQLWTGTGPPPSQLTVGARTEGQKLGVRWENASQLINRTITALRPEYVGVEGYIKHNVLDRWVEQFLPGAGDPQRMTSRSLLSNTREALLRLVNESPDRFTVADRSAIVDIIDGLKPGNSYQNIVQTMNQIKTEFVSRERTWARNQGQLPEVWASSVEELTERVDKLRKNMQMDARIRGEDPSTTEERLEGIVEGWWEIWSTGLPQ